MGTLWARVWDTAITWTQGNFLLANLSPGQTVVRCHFGFRLTGITSTEQDAMKLSEDFMAVGIVTQRSSHGVTPPNALTGALDFAPPLERWIWWSTAQMRPITWDAQQPGVAVWGTDLTALIGDTQGQVKANIPGGETLYVFMTWAPWTTGIWDTRGQVQGSAWASTLIQT